MSYVHHTILVVDDNPDDIKPTSFNTLLVMMKGLVEYWLGLNETPEVGQVVTSRSAST